MVSFLIPAALVRYKSFVDDDAPPILDIIVPSLNCAYLSDLIMGEHEIGNRRVRMRDYVNLVLTAELSGGKFLGFIAAEVNPDTDHAILHILYVLRGYRGCGVSSLLLDAYEDFVQQLGCTNTTVAPITSRLLEIFRARESAAGRIAYDVREPTPEQLASGDAAVAEDYRQAGF